MKLLGSLALFAAFLLRPAVCAAGVRQGLTLAAQQALPALFPFFLASALLVRSGLAEGAGRLAARPLAALYRLPPSAAPAVLLGLVGGYPVGASTTAALVRQGVLDPADAARANTLCNCASPGFCIGLVGLGVFGNASVGAALYGVHVLAALLTGLLTARGGRPTPSAPPTAAPAPRESFAAAFCAAVQQAAATALTVTAFLTVFSVLLALLAPALDRLPCGGALAGLIELTTGLDDLAALPLSPGARLTLASLLLGWGGLSVQFQVRALAEPARIPMDGFTAAKLLHGALAAALTAVLFRLSPDAWAVFAPAQGGWHPAGLSLLLPLCVALLAIRGGKKSKNTV
ncbi:MAG: hypothetical protein Q4D31_05380 [Eubacteriales bacterium]|nr:hypothetical protein [Eubacteriales bacterium]